MSQPKPQFVGASPAATPSLASWYAPGHVDPIGDRLLMFDNTGAPSLELLRFRPDLSDSSEFEAALREQVQRFARFLHPNFARVRSVQRLDPDGDLALVSHHTPGKRLSEVLHRAHGPRFAAALIRQLAPALADFQQQHPGVAHGLLSPDRIVVSPDAGLTIVEHVLGPAMRGVGLDPIQLSAPRLSLPAAAGALTRHGAAAGDWYQLGLVALSVALGREATDADLEALDALFSADGADTTPLTPFREWFERALQLSGAPIESGREGRAAFEALARGEQAPPTRRVVPMRAIAAPTPAPPAAPTVRDEPHPAPRGFGQQPLDESEPTVSLSMDVILAARRGLDTFPTESVDDAQAETVRLRLESEPPQEPSVVDTVRLSRPDVIVAEEPSPRARVIEMRAAPSAPVPPVSEHDAAAPAADSSTWQELSPFEREVLAGRITTPHPVAGQDVKRPARAYPVAILTALVALAVIQAGVIGWMVLLPTSAPTGFSVEQNAGGDAVLVRQGTGEPQPIAVAMGSDLRWVRLSTSRPVIPGAVTAAGGVLRLSSPIPLKVSSGGRALGTLPGGDLTLPAGRHELELVNEGFDYRVRQSLEIAGGETVVVHVVPPPGSMSIQAAVGTEVSIDGQIIGRTPLAPLTLTPGDYQVAFKYARGSIDRQRVTVKSAGTTAVVSARTR